MVNVLPNIFKILSFPVVFLLSFSFLTCFYSSGFLLSARGMSVGGNCPRGLLSSEVIFLGDYFPRGLFSSGVIFLGGECPGGYYPRGLLSWGVNVRGGGGMKVLEPSLGGGVFTGNEGYTFKFGEAEFEGRG